MSDQTAFAADSDWRRIPAWVKEAPIPMPSLPLGLLRLAAHNRWGHPAYLNGELYRYGRWYYFPEAIALKSPLALSIALLLAGVSFVWVRGRGRGLGRATGLALLGAVFLIVIMHGNLDIGVRHVLPVIPLLYLIACAVLVRARWSLPLLLALVALAGIETAPIHPDYLAFFNVAAGGPAGGERFLLDSNLDWGQDVGRLASWLRSEEAGARDGYSMRLFAFPSERLVEHLGLDRDALVLPPSGRFAISKNVLHGVSGAKMNADGTIEATEDYAWLAQYPLVKRIGHSIDVYDLSSRHVADTGR